MSDTDESDDPPSLSEQEQRRALNALLSRHVNQLAEHFSSVQIVATRLAPDGNTCGFSRGSGDWYARCGITHAWLDSPEAFQGEPDEEGDE